MNTINDSYSGAAFREIKHTMYEILCNEREYHDLRCAPHVIMRPDVSKHGKVIYCTYGENPSWIIGVGHTAEEACADFDRVWKGATK